MHVEIRDIEDPEEVKLLEDIQKKVWGGEEIVVPAHIMIAAKEVGGILKGAYIDNKLIGYVHGFLGRYKGQLCMYSHQLAVLREYQNIGIGSLLKFKQREHALNSGLKLIIWTYDPLRSKNAMLNINKLGCITRTYLPNHYGEMNDELNRGIPSDRFMVEWWIDSKWYYKRKRYKYIEDMDIRPKLAIKVVKKELGLIPSLQEDLNDDIIGVEIPKEIDKAGSDAQTIKLMWRKETRDIFSKLFRQGYVVFRYLLYHDEEKGIYLLKKGFDPDDPSTWI